MHIGIDPGLTGAIAVIDGLKLLALHDMPVMTKPGGGAKVKNQIDPMGLAEVLRDIALQHEVEGVVLEQVSTMPKQGVASNASLMHSFGIIEGVVAWLKVPTLLVKPQQWKKAAGLQMSSQLTDSQKKSASLALARRLFPGASLDRVKDHGRAEALLIAYYGAPR